MRFAGVHIILVLVSGQIEVDDDLPNTIFHVGFQVAQVEAAGNPPVFHDAVGFSTLDGDKVCGEVEPCKNIFCNLIDDGEVLGDHARVVALAGDVHRAARRHIFLVAVVEVRALHQNHVAVLNLRLGIDRLSCIELIRDVGNHVGGQALSCDLGSVEVGGVHIRVLVDKLDTYPQSAHILDRWHAVAVVTSPICGVARDAPALRHIIRIHIDRRMLLAVIFPFVGTYHGTQLFRYITVGKGGGGQQRQHHTAEQQGTEKFFSHSLVPPFSL